MAYLFFQKEFSDQQYLSSVPGNQQAEFFIRIQAWQQFAVLNSWNIQRSKKNHWNDTLAICHMLQAWNEIRQGQFPLAEKTLAQAESILRPSGMLERNCRLDWVWGLLREASEDCERGLRHVNDAFLVDGGIARIDQRRIIASPRG